jgi:hypothetical protein
VWIAEDLRVEHEIPDTVGLLDQEPRRAAVVGILGDEPASQRVDENPLQHVRRRIEGRGQERPVETARLAARGDAEQQSGAVVVAGAVLDQIARHPRELVGEHLLVHDVAARREHHAATRAHVAVLAEVAVAHADDASALVRDQRHRARVAAHAHAGLRRCTDQHLHQQ